MMPIMTLAVQIRAFCATGFCYRVTVRGSLMTPGGTSMIVSPRLGYCRLTGARAKCSGTSFGLAVVPRPSVTTPRDWTCVGTRRWA